MGNQKLRGSEITKREVEIQVRPALYARVCDSCGKVFEMPQWCNEELNGVRNGCLRGTFDRHERAGNMFAAHVCSFDCAGKLMGGGWKKLDEYKPFAAMGAKLARAEVRITEMIDEAQIVAQWEAKKHQEIVYNSGALPQGATEQ